MDGARAGVASWKTSSAWQWCLAPSPVCPGPWPVKDILGGGSNSLSLYGSDLALSQASRWHLGNTEEDFKGKAGSGKVKPGSPEAGTVGPPKDSEASDDQRARNSFMLFYEAAVRLPREKMERPREAK